MTILTLDIGGSEIKAALYQTDGSCTQPLPNQKTAVFFSSRTHRR